MPIAHHTSVVVQAAHPRTEAHAERGERLVRPYVTLTSATDGAYVLVLVYGTPAELLALFGPVVDTLRQHLVAEVPA